MNDNGGWPVWQTLLLGVVGIALAFLLISWLAPVAFECPPFDKNHPDACSAIIRNNGLAVAGLFAGLVGLVALQLNARRTQTDRLRLTNDTYVKAIEQLSSASMEVRIGAMYALERIAHEEQRYHWPIIETLAAYIRERAPWPPRGPEEAKGLDAIATAITTLGAQVTERLPPTSLPPDSPSLQPEVRAERASKAPDAETPTTSPNRAPTDIQTALTIIAQRSNRWRMARAKCFGVQAGQLGIRIDRLSEGRSGRTSYLRPFLKRLTRLMSSYAMLRGGEPRPLNLRQADLRYVDLFRVRLPKTILVGANLQKADLRGANLRGANLSNSILRGANLSEADLVDGFLVHQFKWNSALLYAYEHGADISQEVDLSGANLLAADLRGVILRRANLSGANLNGALFSDHPRNLGALWDKANPPRGLDEIIIENA